MNDKINEFNKSQQPPKTQGEITIEKTVRPKNQNRNTDDEDYVDYEEMK